MTTDLGLPLPWPVPKSAPEHADAPILIWGGSSSVGQYAIQILKHWGYRNILSTSSPTHHALLTSYGAKACFDYRSSSAIKDILAAAGDEGVRFVLDCIGSQSGSLSPISKIARDGSKVAVLLPVIVRDASETEAPIYQMDVRKGVAWEEGVDVRGVRTHFYCDVRLPSVPTSKQKLKLIKT